ncbi:MAG: hypothetical protein G01um101420_674 [Parcubacteria group bacterium Gr01-1014_20]|nr:MAG: hypothetical protein G01um101420_674 [Parcubacteria group bacterium Gr01-1014_20]
MSNAFRSYDLEVSGGSVIGKDHRRDGRNNQDAYFFKQGSGYAVALVADGCGSSRYSEVGSHIAVELVGSLLLEQALRFFCGRKEEEVATMPRPLPIWERVRLDAVSNIRVLSNQMGPSLSKSVNDYFLFTLVGALITPIESYFFSIGDGVIFVNGEMIQIGPFENNAPPYLGYEIVGSDAHSGADAFHFKVHRSLPTENLDSFLVGTDGVMSLVAAEAEFIPGKEEFVGPISQFWNEARFFTNPQTLQRALNLINREAVLIDWERQKVDKEKGHLPDDTTLVVGRLAPRREGE